MFEVSEVFFGEWWFVYVGIRFGVILVRVGVLVLWGESVGLVMG